MIILRGLGLLGIAYCVLKTIIGFNSPKRLDVVSAVFAIVGYVMIFSSMMELYDQVDACYGA